MPSFRGLAVAADRAAIDAATTILTAGGNAADAASAMGLVLSVTLPSRAGLGGGGACQIYDPATREVRRLDFPARPASPAIDARWRAAVPHMARGFYALHARAGKLPWAQIVAPAETLARFGFRVSPLLAADIKAGGETLGNDRAALSLVLTRGRQLAVLGDTLTNADLAMTLSRMRARGPGSFYEGAQAKDLADAADAAGASVSIDDLRGAVPEWTSPAAERRGDSVVVKSGRAIGEAAATAYLAADGEGRIVVCAVGMNHPFGLGIAARGHGFVFAPAEPGPLDPLLMLAFNETNGDAYLAAAAAGPRAAAAGDIIDAASAGGRIDVGALDPIDADGSPNAILSCRTGLANDGKACLMRSWPPQESETIFLER